MVWNINYGTNLISSMSQSTFQTDNQNSAVINSFGNNSEYAKILAEKIAEVDSEFEETKDNLSNQNQSSDNGKNSSSATETIKRFMPDGSIMITTYDGSSIVNQIKLRPHLVPVADYSAPPEVSGEPSTKFEMKQSLDLLSLLM